MAPILQVQSITGQAQLVRRILKKLVMNFGGFPLTWSRGYAVSKSYMRLTELKGKTPSQNKTVRLKLQEIYDFLVDFTAINAYAYPDKKQYADLRDHLNAIRSRYKKPSQLRRRGKKRRRATRI